MAKKSSRTKANTTDGPAAYSTPSTDESHYQEGVAAFRKGEHLDDNPYPREVQHGRCRYLWYCGYLDQRHAKWNGVGEGQLCCGSS
jgi:hypothetical protein